MQDLIFALQIAKNSKHLELLNFGKDSRQHTDIALHLPEKVRNARWLSPYSTCLDGNVFMFLQIIGKCYNSLKFTFISSYFIQTCKSKRKVLKFYSQIIISLHLPKRHESWEHMCTAQVRRIFDRTIYFCRRNEIRFCCVFPELPCFLGGKKSL